MEKRREPRFTCAGEATMHLSSDEQPSSATLRDLSAHGCLLDLCRPLTLGEGLHLELAFTVNQLPFRLAAEVCAPRSSTRAGVLFLQVSPRSRDRLMELIQELAEEDSKRRANLTLVAAYKAARANAAH